MHHLGVVAFFFASLATAATIDVHLPLEPASNQPPLVIWHGLGDTYDAEGLNNTAKLAEKVNPGTYVYIIRLGDDSSADRQATFFGNLTEQLDTVCQDLASNPHLRSAGSINALGFSQGGQFLRAFVEKCNVPPVRSLVTFGSQHNGISKFQDCGATDWVCKGAEALLSGGTVWSDFVQSRLVPAQYFRDPEDLEGYLESSNFLADVNNERKKKNKLYKKHFSSLESFVMYLFEDDTTVIPKESGWFAEVNATSGDVTPLRQRQIYKDDWLGLKTLDEKGSLVFKTTPGGHMRLDEDVLRDTFKTYFGPTKSDGKESSKYAETIRVADEQSEALWDDL